MNIKEYVKSLHTIGDINLIDAEISPHLEISAITDLVCKRCGPGLLFKSVKGTDYAVATNLVGSDRRMAQALGYESLQSFGDQLKAELTNTSGATSTERLHRVLQGYKTQQVATKRCSYPVNLNLLPDMRFWPEEIRSFLTLAVVISRAPENNLLNYGLYRVGIVDSQRLTLNLLPGSGGGQHLEQWRHLGKEMPVAIVLGADPSLIFAAAASLPQNCSEELFSAYLSRANFETCPCDSIPIDCPTSGQIVLEGLVSTEETLNEGPFGCYTGDYGGSNVCPVVKVVAQSMVDDPLIPLTLAGPMPMEDCWIAKANLELIRARLIIDLPAIGSIEMPMETAFHGLYFLRSVDATLTVEEIALKVKSLAYLSRIKMLILLGTQDPDVTDENWRAILAQASATQIWQSSITDLKDLLGGRPAKLQHDSIQQQSLLQRFNLNTKNFRV